MCFVDTSSMATMASRWCLCMFVALPFLACLLAEHGARAAVFRKQDQEALHHVHQLAQPSPRTVVTFDYGWRFRHGHAPDGAPGPGEAGFADISNYTACTNMEHNPNRFTAGDCMTGCAYSRGCFVWQQDGQKHCFHGGQDAVCSKQKGSAAGNGAAPVFPDGGQRKSIPAIRNSYDFAQRALDDAKWQVVDVPHDFVVSGDFEDMDDTHHGYLPRNVSWYRKHFHLPADWEGSHIAVHFEGVFHAAQTWVNGQYVQIHTDGYTGFTVRLDNITSLQYGNSESNVIAVRVDATFGSGHWYEGGGIYRRTHLTRTGHTHFTHDGVFVSPQVSSAGSTPSVIQASAELETTGGESAVSTVRVLFNLLDSAGKVLASNTSASVRVAGNATTLVSATLHATGISLWSVQTPTLYVVRVQALDGASTVIDNVNISTGFRNSVWSSAGLELNSESFKLRGFSHHNSFTGVGVAIPDRIHLFRAQASRAVGGSFWRMSHNPYLPALYDFLDILGVLTWDENRDYGPEYVGAMHDMVKRDRSHPSILMWSFCNEYECLQSTNNTGLAFRAAAKGLDPQRPTAANGKTSGLDIQGMSHAGNSSFEKFHQAEPSTPLVLSECCSCQTQRLHRLDTTTCMHDQNSPGLLPYVAGSLGVWTLFDYYGESHAWPSVTSSFGNFDLAGFPKPHAYWYVLNWLVMVDSSDHGRPPVSTESLTRILDLPESIVGSVAVLTSGTQVEVYLDGKSSGRQPSPGTGEPVVVAVSGDCHFPQNLSNVQCHGLHYQAAVSAEECQAACCADETCLIWQFTKNEQKNCFIGSSTKDKCKESTRWVGGGRSSVPTISFSNITAVSYDASSSIVGTHTVLKGKTAVAIKLELDVPSPTTGTGSKLVLDGHDAALVRASVVDDNGVLMSNSSHNVTFKVLQGEALLIGVGNGDNNCHQNAKSDHVPVYGGMARAIFQVAVDCVSDHRDLIGSIDIDQGPTRVQSSACESQPESIVVVATSDGLSSAQLTIPVSSSPADLPRSVAKENINLESYPYLTDFVG
eukprot:scpid35265/ scgid34812/ Beta-galactosidase; Lactase